MADVVPRSSLTISPRVPASNTPPDAGSSGGHSGNPHRVSVEYQVLDGGEEGLMVLRSRGSFCHCLQCHIRDALCPVATVEVADQRDSLRSTLGYHLATLPPSLCSTLHGETTRTSQDITTSDISSPHKLTAPEASPARAGLNALVESWMWVCGPLLVVNFEIGRDIA